MRILINFSKENQDVVPHLKKQHNMSAYVASLIRADMKKEQLKEEQILTKDQVIELIKDVLKSQNIELKNTQEMIEGFPMDSVMNLLNMGSDVDG